MWSVVEYPLLNPGCSISWLVDKHLLYSLASVFEVVSSRAFNVSMFIWTLPVAVTFFILSDVYLQSSWTISLCKPPQQTLDGCPRLLRHERTCCVRDGTAQFEQYTLPIINMLEAGMYRLLKFLSKHPSTL